VSQLGTKLPEVRSCGRSVPAEPVLCEELTETCRVPTLRDKLLCTTWIFEAAAATALNSEIGDHGEGK
jgi:hypothetical protein